MYQIYIDYCRIKIHPVIGGFFTFELPQNKCNDMDSKHYQVLQELAPHGVGVYVDISPVLNKIFPVDDLSNKQAIVDNEYKLVQRLIQGMVKNSLMNIESYNIGEWTGQDAIRWLNNTSIMAAISSKGLELIEDELAKSETQKLNESTLTLNKSTKKTNKAIRNNIKTQDKIQWINIGMAAVSTLFIIITGIKTYTDKQEEKLQGIQNSLQELTRVISKSESYRPSSTDTSQKNNTTDTISEKY